MQFRFKLAAGAVLVALLAGITGVCPASEGPSSDGTSAVKELLRLLQAKGVVTGEEARELEKKFGHSSTVSNTKLDEKGPKSAGKSVKTSRSESPDVDVLDTIAFLESQGVIRGDEKAELIARADAIKRRGRGETVPERQRREVGAVEIEYGKTTAPVEEIRDKLKLLAYQNVMTRAEAAKTYRRFGENYTTAQGAVEEPTAVAVEGNVENAVVRQVDAENEAPAGPVSEQQQGKTPFVYGDVVENIDALADQGIIGDRETDELKSRADLLNSGSRIEPVAGKKRIHVGRGEIPYRRTTVDVDEVKDDLKFLTYQGVMTRAESAAAFARFEKKYPTDQLVDNISDELSWEVKSQVEEKMDRVSALERKDARIPEWLDRISLGGDFRLRYERDFFANDNGDFLDPSNPTQLLNSHKDTNLIKIRSRLNLKAQVNDYFESAIGLATGNTNNPVSTNATLGTSLNKENFLLDLAYLKWTPTPDLAFWGGRFPNPWFHTDLVWDPDLNFDGVAFTCWQRITDSSEMFLTGGAFPIQSMSLTSNSKWLFASQLGALVRPADKISAKLGIALYDFEHTVGIVNNPANPGATDWTAPQFQQKGNTLMDIDPSPAIKTAYASAFRELNITGMLDLGYWDPTHVIITADYVNNLGFNQQDVDQRTGTNVRQETVGYQFGAQVGYPAVRNFAEWKAFLYYKYLGSDAVMDAFTDSDFHMGGTNAKGWILGGEFGLAKNIWLASKWLSTNQISGPPFGIDTFFLDLNAKF